MSLFVLVYTLCDSSVCVVTSPCVARSWVWITPGAINLSLLLNGHTLFGFHVASWSVDAWGALFRGEAAGNKQEIIISLLGVNAYLCVRAYRCGCGCAGASLCLRACSHSYPAWNANEPYCLRPLSLHKIFRYYLTKTRFSGKSYKAENVCFWFIWNISPT